MTDVITIRPAREDEVPLVLQFVRELAEYEHLLHEAVASEERVRRDLFGPRPYAEVVFACLDDEPVGFALFFHNYSTFVGKPGIYLEDLFVRPTVRGKGLGKALLTWLAAETVRRDCGRLEWSVLDWNEPSMRFYKGLGAKPMDEWTIFRLTGDALVELAQKERSPQSPGG
jgi:GNAT superfamily N-acetyltransferase